MQAEDVPSQSTAVKYATVQVTINVLRNPNAPVFNQGLYNLTISEYISVQDNIVTVTATDNDSPFVSSLFLARLHFSAEELLLYPQRPRPHAKC